MKVKQRLQHGLVAGLMTGFSVAMLPGSAWTQIIEASDPYAPADSAVVDAESTDSQPEPTELAPIDSLYLQARRAVALGNVEMAQQILQQISANPNSRSAIGDTPEKITSLITRQNGLAEMAVARNPAYNQQAADFLVFQADALVRFGDLATAETLVAQAKKFPADFNAITTDFNQLIATIERMKTGASAPVGGSESDIDQVLRLMAQAELAFDQGDLDSAKSLTMQAKNLGVADTKLPANQTLPWQLELKIQDAMNSGGDVVAASFNKTSGDDVVQADYYPETDTTRNVQVAATTHAGVDPGAATIPEFAPIPNKAMQLFESGMDALKANDNKSAREYLQLAWQNRDMLDATTQQTIQDQLNGLTEEIEPVERVVPREIVDATPDLNTQPDPGTTASDEQQQQMFRQLQSEIFRQRAAAERARESDPRTAIQILTQMRTKVASAEISDRNRRPLLNFIDRDIAEIQQYLEQNLSSIQLGEDNAVRMESVTEAREQRYNTELQIQKLVEDFNDLIDEQRWEEARIVARQAEELDPDSEIVALLKEKAELQTNLAVMEQIQREKQENYFNRLADVDRDTINPVSEDMPLLYGDSDEFSRNRRRRDLWLSEQEYRSPEEAKIWNLLRNEQVQGHYQGTLADAINQLSEQSGVNIIFDSPALAADSISVDSSVDVPIRQPISLRSALSVILGTSGLVFIVEDEVVKVTSRDAQRRDVKPKTWYVGDLVTPIQNFSHSLSMNFMTPGGQVGSNGFMGQGGQVGRGVPLANQLSGSISPLQMASQAAAATLPDGALAQQLPGLPGLARNPFLGSGGGPVQSGTPTYNSTGPQAPGGVTEADFQPLIRLIRNTIDPDGWDDTNGDGTIQAFVPNLSLIVSQTQEVQDEIQDLLNQLRELNDVQIVVEVRFVSLADNFFERIGVDFDFNLNDNSGLNPAGIPEALGGQPSTVIGLSNSDDAPIFTPDLDIPFRQGSFSSTAPFFGGFDPASAASFGFAILSDIEVFFLINAAKGDQRTNITQAPTVTMFNGQVASVSDGAQVPFVTSVTPVVGDFAVAQQPIITLLPEGASLNVQATVSHDRKSVRMTLVPFFSQITNVDTFTFDGSTTTQRASDESLIDDLLGVVTGENPNQEDPTEIETVTQGVTVQLPTLGFTTVSTVVSVPDGGTILIGGVKRQTEQRVERGVPFLSNVPYVSRLFKNVGIGRETSSLMMMVTPRIIIQEEEEELQVGSFDN